MPATKTATNDMLGNLLSLRNARAFRNNGVLGLNERNRDYVMRYNPRHCYPLVDDKLKTKRLAERADIAVPTLYGALKTPHDLLGLAELLEKHNDFVIKPAHGSGGNGVLVITGRRKQLYAKPDGSRIDLQDLQFHTSNIISGVFSLGGVPDTAMIEYRVIPDPIFNAISHQGVPDIRLLIFRGVPAMAMIRLPTRESDGKANLHQGAVGVGIDMLTGKTTSAVYKNRLITEHPNTEEALCGLQIPAWDDLLALGASCYELTGLGYLGVDIVLDRHLGPLILEINARPGLAIQIANRCGLKKTLDNIEKLEGISTASIGTRVASIAELARQSE